MSVAYAAALVQIDAAHGAVEQARGRLDELATTGLESLRPDMLYLWALAELARGCVLLRAAHYAPRVYQALARYAGRGAVAAGAVMCSGSTDFYLAGLAALGDDVTAAERHYRAAVSCHRRLGARPMLAHTLRDYALLLRQRAGPDDLPAASAALAEARAIAVECGMTKLLAALDQPDQPMSILTLNREDDFWLISYGDTLARAPDSLGLHLPGPARPPSRPGPDRPGPGPARGRHRPGRRLSARRRPARRVRGTSRAHPRPASPDQLPAAPETSEPAQRGVCLQRRFSSA